MAYFANGSEGLVFDYECSNCFAEDKNCPVATIQLTFNYDQCDNENLRHAMNMLVTQKGEKYEGCQVKKIIDMILDTKDVEGQIELF